MQVCGDKYSVTYNPETATLTCSGVLDLRGKESYKDISELFDRAADRSPSPERIISETTYNNKQTIFRLKNVRDIIAHCIIDDLKEDKLKNILAQFKILISSYEKELNYKIIKAVIDESEIKRYKLELETKLQEEIEKHKKLWENNKNDTSYIKNARIQTIMMDRLHPEADNSYLIECPVCSQRAVLFVYEDYGLDDHADIVLENTYIKNLSCYFCDFYVEEPEVIDYLKLNEAKRVQIDW